MTRKDYILIAQALNERYALQLRVATKEVVDGVEQIAAFDAGAVTGIHAAASSLADALAVENPRFDREHFLAVVRGEKSLTSRPGRKS